MTIFSTLNKEQKEAFGLLQVGTFLEYFDLMLYIHMAVLLNDLFFPKIDPFTDKLLQAFAFCSTWVLRPLGAIIFGYIGDHLGRKPTVIIATIIMAISCVVMACLPTYAQMGIAATWILTACRIAQGMSSMGEIIGAEIYLTETNKPPVRYPLVAFVGVASTLGGSAALGVATLATMYNFNWRNAFWAGALIAVIGIAARTRLRETPDFVDMKRRMKIALEKSNPDGTASETVKNISSSWKEKVDNNTLFAYFLLSCCWPICFYFTYVHCGGILKSTFAYSPNEIIRHNLIVASIAPVSFIIFALLSAKIHPLKLLRAKLVLFFPFILICPFILDNMSSPYMLMFVQTFSIVFSLNYAPAGGVILPYIPVFRRFTYTSLLNALARALMYIITAFGLVYLTEIFGHIGLLIIMAPMATGFCWGTEHFMKLEKKFYPERFSQSKARPTFQSAEMSSV